MSFKDAVQTVLTTKFATFGGRARRSEFWWFALFNLIASVVVGIIDLALDTQILGWILTLALLVPSLAVGARRLHDTNRSGWWQLLHLILFFGTVVLIVFWVQEGQAGSNQHGPSPKGGNEFGNVPPAAGWGQPQ